MAPNYATPDLTKVQAGFTVLPKGDYEVSVGEPKAFERTNNEGKTSAGVRYMLTVINPEEKKGARQMFTCYLHSEGAQQFSKGFVMACLGYNPKSSQDEEAFNARFGGADWGFNPEAGSVGDVWREINGTHVIVSLDIQINKESNEPQQKFVSCRPVVAAA